MATQTWYIHGTNDFLHSKCENTRFVVNLFNRYLCWRKKRFCFALKTTLNDKKTTLISRKTANHRIEYSRTYLLNEAICAKNWNKFLLFKQTFWVSRLMKHTNNMMCVRAMQCAIMLQYLWLHMTVFSSHQKYEEKEFAVAQIRGGISNIESSRKSKISKKRYHEIRIQNKSSLERKSVVRVRTK